MVKTNEKMTSEAIGFLRQTINDKNPTLWSLIALQGYFNLAYQNNKKSFKALFGLFFIYWLLDDKRADVFYYKLLELKVGEDHVYDNMLDMHTPEPEADCVQLNCKRCGLKYDATNYMKITKEEIEKRVAKCTKLYVERVGKPSPFARGDGDDITWGEWDDLTDIVETEQYEGKTSCEFIDKMFSSMRWVVRSVMSHELYSNGEWIDDEEALKMKKVFTEDIWRNSFGTTSRTVVSDDVKALRDISGPKSIVRLIRKLSAETLCGLSNSSNFDWEYAKLRAKFWREHAKKNK